MNDKYVFPQMNRESYKPIYIQVSELIIDYAKKNKLGPGDLLPSENLLISKLEVSRNTVRLAVERLAKMGFLKKVRGQGTFLTRKRRPSLDLDATQGFEGSLKSLGLTVENKIVEKRLLDNDPPWTAGLVSVNSDQLMLIRRLKTSLGRILALEDRILPEHVLGRYSDDELKEENICPYLLERYPDTDLARFKYYFSMYSTSKTVSDLLETKEGASFLQRTGEYYNSNNECFMVGRHIFIAADIKVCYEIEKKDDFWALS